MGSYDITEKTWPDILVGVQKKMSDYLRPCLASISKTKGDGTGSAHGSGVYVSVRSLAYLLTCEHVARYQGQAGYRLAYLLSEKGDYFAFSYPFVADRYPADLAVTRIPDELWQAGERRSVSLDKVLSPKPCAVDELYFLGGFPGERAYFNVFDTDPELISGYVPYTARLVPLPPALDAEFHVALAYPPMGIVSADGSRHTLINAHGFSGSPVWNTRFVESGFSEEWTPAESTFVGIVNRWDQPNGCLIITRLEKIMEFLSAVLPDLARI